MWAIDVTARFAGAVLLRGLACRHASFDLPVWALAVALFRQTVVGGWHGAKSAAACAGALVTAACCFWHASKFLDTRDYPSSLLANEVQSTVVLEPSLWDAGLYGTAVAGEVRRMEVVLLQRLRYSGPTLWSLVAGGVQGHASLHVAESCVASILAAPHACAAEHTEAELAGAIVAVHHEAMKTQPCQPGGSADSPAALRALRVCYRCKHASEAELCRRMRLPHERSGACSCEELVRSSVDRLLRAREARD